MAQVAVLLRDVHDGPKVKRFGGRFEIALQGVNHGLERKGNLENTSNTHRVLRLTMDIDTT